MLALGLNHSGTQGNPRRIPLRKKPDQTFKVARLQSEFCTKDFFRATNFLTKNAPKFSLKILSLCSVGQKKSPENPSKFPTKFSKFPCEKSKKFTDELLQERRENKLSSTLIRLPLPQCFCLRGRKLRPWSKQNSDQNSDHPRLCIYWGIEKLRPWSKFLGRENSDHGLSLGCLWGRGILVSYILIISVIAVLELPNRIVPWI